jgi:hypothetical protein
LTNVVINWEGEKVDLDKPWYDANLFKIGDVEVTTGTLAGVSGGAIAAGAIGFSIMSFIAWRKRKLIKKSARRLSATILRASVSIRNSIRGSLPGIDQTIKAKEDPFGIRAARDATNVEEVSSSSSFVPD